MVDPSHRHGAGNTAPSREDPLAELERVVSGQFERRRPAASEATAAIDPSALDFEAELIRQMDSPSTQAVSEPDATELAPASAASPAANEPKPQPPRGRATPVDPNLKFGANASSRSVGRASAVLPEHRAPSLDSSLEDQLLGELGLDVELFGNVVKRKKPTTEDLATDQQFAEALETELANDQPEAEEAEEGAAAEGAEDLDALAQEFSGAAHEEIGEPSAQEAVREPREPSPPQAFSEIDLDFGKAFKTAFEKIESDRNTRKLHEEQEAARQSVSLANASENTLEAHFASAFADELALGVAELHGQVPAARAQEETAPATRRAARAQQKPAARSARTGLDAPAAAEHAGQIADAEDFELDDREFDSALQEEMIASQHQYGAPVRSERRLAKYGVLGFAVALTAALGATAYLYFSDSGDTGAPALIRADDDPVKVKPQNQGGTEIANSDKAAYERLSGKFNAEPNQEKLVDSAEDPIEIARTDSDAVVQSGAAGPAPLANQQADKLDPVVEAVPDQEAAGAAGSNDDAKADDRLPSLAQQVASRSIGGALSIQPRRVRTVTVLADGTIVQSDPKPEAGASKALANQAEEQGSAAAKVADQLAKTNSVEPVKVATVRVRQDQQGANQIEQPANDQAVGQGQAAQENKVDVASLETETQNLARDEWAVQVSSQRTPEEAEAAFRNLKGKFPSLLDGKKMTIQRADLGEKGTFFRVRISASSKEEASTFCNNLKTAGGSCFVTR